MAYGIGRQATWAFSHRAAAGQRRHGGSVLSDTQKQALAQLIAGKNVQEAQQALDAQPGVERATIQLFGGQTLPSDPAKITIVVQVAR